MTINLSLLATPYAFYTNPEHEAPEGLRELVYLIQSASKLVFTTAEYNRTIPPALTNLLDHLPHSALAYKPAAVISYSIGSDGGQVSAYQLRNTLSELGCLVVPHTIILYNLNARVSAEGEPSGSSEQCQALLDEVDLVLQQVEYFDEAFRRHRSMTDMPEPKLHPYI